MSDQEDDKKILNDEGNTSENENQSSVEEKNQSEDVKIESEETPPQENLENQTSSEENQNNEPNDDVSAQNNYQTIDNSESSEVSNQKKMKMLDQATKSFTKKMEDYTFMFGKTNIKVN